MIGVKRSVSSSFMEWPWFARMRYFEGSASFERDGETWVSGCGCGCGSVVGVG